MIVNLGLSVSLRWILMGSVLTTSIWFTFLAMYRTKRFFQPRHRNLYEYDSFSTIPKTSLERMHEYLQYTDFEDYLLLANIYTSEASVKKTEFKVGDEIKVDIVLYNGRGERATVGGDMLRIWLRERSLRASVAGYVIDHGNGSYTGIVKAMWTGCPELMFAIGNTKEHIGIFMNIVQKYGVIEFLQAGFRKNNVTVYKLCSVIPNIPDVKEYCNFTAQNFNMSFFCSKAKDFTCEDWIFYSRSGYRPCKREHESFFRYLKKRVTVLNVLKTNKTGSVRSPEISCRDVSSVVTWHTTNPTGYFLHGRWQSSICKSSLTRYYNTYLECLKDRLVLMTGDSTTRNWFVPLAGLLRLKVMNGEHEIKDKAWQKFAEAVNSSLGVHLYWTPHEIPFYSHEQHKDNLRSIASRIDELPSNASAIVILHWFGHLTRTTPQQYREHVRSAKEGVLRLLKRSPRSAIFIKGPHSFTHSFFVEPFDYLSRVYRQILYEELMDLQHRVYLIDQWDATVGNENLDIHPTFPSFNEMMLNFVFSFIC
ncbi:NXPE family member 3-like isoform X2 [Argopecten irradians]|uniref:NXPE family member 3-like isoform X2 n=1 Tax=Argopecten irradians TaxID=31199 RepID=UPI003715D303